MAGQRLDEVDGPRALEVGQAAAAEVDQLGGQRRRRRDAGDELDHRAHLLAPFVVGNPDRGDVDFCPDREPLPVGVVSHRQL